MFVESGMGFLDQNNGMQKYCLQWLFGLAQCYPNHESFTTGYDQQSGMIGHGVQLAIFRRAVGMALNL